ncbi:MAG: caspase family protein [Phormidesmis sp.]
MAKNLYALLVGINQYDGRSRVPHLRGCVNDIEGMQSYLEGRVAAPKEKAAALEGPVAADDWDGFELHLQVLTDSQATRQGIIDGFKQHLAQASSGDVVLFYYAGHGAQAKAPEAFWPVSPGRMMETLVCYDSRIDDEHWDLADKELGQLIAELDAKQPHIAVVLDCCHSGSGTREVAPNGLEETEQVATRRAEIDYRDRPLGSFLLSPADALAMSTQSGKAAGTRSLIEMPMTLQLPLGRHVVLSACNNLEEAKEYHGSGIPRGAFSHFLQESLSKANGSLSYRDLFKRTNALIRSGVPAQSPQLEATNSEDLEQPFLGGAIAPTPPYFTISHHKDYGWSIDGGAIHGLQPSAATEAGNETTVLAVYPFDADAQQMKKVSQAIAQVGITKVFAQLSTVAIRESDGSDPIFADQTTTFKAVVISSPLPPLQVYLEGDKTGIEALKSAIATVGPQGSASLYVRTIDQIDGAAFRVLVQDDAYTIASPTDARALVTPVRGYNSIAATKVAQNLEHIARWKTIAELASPASSRIQGAVKLKIYTGEEATPEAAKEIKSSQIRLDYRYDTSKQKWMRPRFRIKLHNTSNQTLYCAFFYLTERFKVDVIKPDGVTSVVRLAPDQEIWFANGKALNGTVADALWQQGITECLDILKLIACTDEFDPTLMILGELGLPPVSGRTRSLASAGGGSLNRLMQRVNTRDIGFDDGEEVYDDWVANQIGFTFVRPQPSTPVDRTQSAAVGAGVTIQPHSALSANVRLTTVPQSTRDLGSFILPPLLQAHTEALQFTQSRASDPGLSAIELNNIRNPEAVTAENPLVIEAEVPLGDDEYVLPIAHDGEFYLPLGYGKRSKTGKTEIVIERLTEPISEGNRSVTGSVRIFFQKIVNKKLGLAFDYPLLAIAQLEQPAQSTAKKAASPKVTYIREAEAVKAKVAEAQNIAIYVHGIFGDTESMLPSLDSAIATLEDNNTPIGELYDLVLAFDYENLNTTIDQNARLLKERLAAVGLQTSHGKTVHIIAHSMGGLVSRWFIEQEGGQEIVSHLIMLGTPNSGSPWPQVQAGVTAGVSFALNGLSLVAAPLKILEGLLKRIETIDVSLDQMEPGSDFLAEMAKAPDPGIPYTLVVGNTSLITAEAETLKEKIMQRLGKLVELPFFEQPNDIAVSVNSIVSIPEGRSPAPRQLPTACNHLEYFVHPAGLASLTEAVVGTGIRSSQGLSNSNRGGREPALASDQGLPEPPEPSEPSAPSAPSAPSDPFAQGEPTQTMTESDETTRSSFKLWIFGIVALLIAVGIIFGLTQKPASTPTVPESTPESTE